MRAIRRLNVRATLPDELSPLLELVHNLRWSWHDETRDLFASIDPALWGRVEHSPMRMLGRVSPQRWAELAADDDFRARLHAAREDLQAYLTRDRWYQSQGPAAPSSVAYFSPEFGVTAVLPQYSGGLGILAGDHLKTASDLGVPIIGVGLLYRHGYFAQSLSREGWQQERYPTLDPNSRPLTLLHDADGAPVVVTLDLPERALHARVWRAQVGRVPLLLLDSDIEANAPHERQVTDRLYGGGGEHRLRQELLLGVGGVRAVRAFCRLTGTPAPEVFHMNEGHAGFLGLERIRELIDTDRPEGALSFDEALAAVRASTIFTTHTPVPAGIDRFPRSLVEQHFGGRERSVVGPSVPLERVLQLGTERYEGGDPAVFNMAVMGLRLAQRANGVSQLHGHVARDMFSGLWPDFDADDVPIGSITNGVHAPSWMAREARELMTSALGTDFEADGIGPVNTDLLDDAALWRLRRTLRERLVQEARNRLRESWLQRGGTETEMTWISTALDPDVLTIGFARRVPSYKRLTLMLRDPERLRALLLDPVRPVQFIIAGKAHPADDAGKRLIQEIVRFADDAEVRHRIVFLPGYDMALATVLCAGADVWLNNPLRPLEACGTSGMKAALNGALNLSIRDGWWDEWFDGDNGWAIPSADQFDEDQRDDLEAAALYDLLENQIAPRFYDHGGHDLPTRWLEMVRHTLASLTPKVVATRMVRDYVGTLYTPAAQASRAIAADGFAGARRLASWRAGVEAAWSGVRVEHVEASEATSGLSVGGALEVRAIVTLGALTPDDVEVQAIAGSVGEGDEIEAPAVSLLRLCEGPDADRRAVYEGEIALDRTGPFGYSVRVLPSDPMLCCGAELGLVAVPDAPEGMVTGDLR